MITMSTWFTYVDWTLEQIPRPFNVGKGNVARIKDVNARNVVWKRIAKKYGHRREIVFSSNDEGACFEREQQLILEYKTCPYLEGGWGSNLSLGGPGPTGAKWSDDAKNHLSNVVTSMWCDPTYRQKLMTLPPVDLHQLQIDSKTMVWDDIAQKYNVSATTVKRWFRDLGLIKPLVKQRRKPWTSIEDEQLFQLYTENKSVRAIATVMCRSECSIKKRIQKLCDERGIVRTRYRRCS